MNENNINLNKIINNLLNDKLDVNQIISESLIQTLLSHILNSLMTKERDLFIQNNPSSVKNGFYQRKDFSIGSIPISLSIPRTRDSIFFPSILPKYSRTLPDMYKNLISSLILSSQSINSLKLTLSSLNLPFNSEQIDQIVNELAEEYRAINTRELQPDWLFIFADAKVIEIRNEQKETKKAVILTAIGINMAGEKHYLGSIIRYGNENLEAWKELFENLAVRGVRRVLMVITDNFSGIEKVIKGYYPLAMTQFCLVHLIRNARYRLSKEEWKIFREKIEMIEKVNRYEEADRLMEEIIEMVEKKHRSFAKEIRKDKERYIAFVKFPKEIRSRIKSNNASENFHKEIEKIRINSGGYFQSERILEAKVCIMIKRIEYGRWRKGEPLIKGYLYELDRMFKEVYGE